MCVLYLQSRLQYLSKNRRRDYMTSPGCESSASSTQLGWLVGDYPANSLQRYASGIIGVVTLWIALFGTIGNIEFDGGWRTIMLVFAVGAGVQLYFGIGAHAQLF